MHNLGLNNSHFGKKIYKNIKSLNTHNLCCLKFATFCLNFVENLQRLSKNIAYFFSPIFC